MIAVMRLAVVDLLCLEATAALRALNRGAHADDAFFSETTLRVAAISLRETSPPVRSPILIESDIEGFRSNVSMRFTIQRVTFSFSASSLWVSFFSVRHFVRGCFGSISIGCHIANLLARGHHKNSCLCGRLLK